MNPPQYVICYCQHCEGGIEFDANQLSDDDCIVSRPHCGIETKLACSLEWLLSTPENKPTVGLPPGPEPTPSVAIPATPTPFPQNAKSKKRSSSRLPRLTEVTIRAKTKTGDTPLHRAAKEGRIHEIPRHLFQAELFMVRNNSGETSLHLAAKHGHLDQVPAQFLTRETLTLTTAPHWAPQGLYTTGTGYVARTETVLHIAVSNGHADQIPKEFLTPEYLTIPVRGDGCALLHYLADNNRLDLIADEYANSSMWNLQDRRGRTARDVLNARIEWETHGKPRSEARLAALRNEPATEPQKEKLRWFGCTWEEGITKGQAHDMLDECAKRFPQRDHEYYHRRATEEQLRIMRRYLKHFGDGEEPEDYGEDGQPLTYGQAKDAIRDLERAVQREEIDSLGSEQSLKSEALFHLDCVLEGKRDLTNEEFDKIWYLAKSRMSDKSVEPQPAELVRALAELFPEFLR